MRKGSVIGRCHLHPVGEHTHGARDGSAVRTVARSDTLNELPVAGSVGVLHDPDPPAIDLTPEALVLAPGLDHATVFETINSNIVRLSMTNVLAGFIPIRFPAVAPNTTRGIRLAFRVSDLEDGAPPYGNVDTSHVAEITATASSMSETATPTPTSCGKVTPIPMPPPLPAAP